MFDRKHIERILKINGVSLPAPDEEIRSVLLGARYRDEEVDMALLVLKETITQSDQSADSLQKLIRTDQSLSAKEISKLLGIEVTLTPKSEIRKSPSSPQLTLGHHIVILAPRSPLLVCLVFSWLCMYWSLAFSIHLRLFYFMKPGSGIVLNLALFFTLIVSTLVAHAVVTLSAPADVRITTTSAPSPTRAEPQATTPALEPEATTTNSTSLWFLGDTMLSREVASIAKREGTDYSFRGVAGLFTGASVVANFEACFSPAKRFSMQEMMRFPVLPEFAPVMRTAGVTHVSLANNHGLDCGASDLLFTRETFTSASIMPFGHPVSFATTSVTYLTVANTRIALIALHTLFSLPTDDELKTRG